MLDFWTNLGVPDISNCTKHLPVVDGRISIDEVRHFLDSSIRDSPVGNIILASYKTEILFLWEQFQNSVQESEKLRSQCLATEDRNSVLIRDVEANQSRLGEEHNSLVHKVEREWKEKYEKSKAILQGEIEFLDASLNRQVDLSSA